jgi:glutathione synthase/RimK-type ligase-like ATP-grasp enzyme
MILIITDNLDSHVDIVVKKLTLASFRLNLDVDSLLDTKISFENDDWYITQNNNSVKASKITCVWARCSSVKINLDHQNNISNGFRLWRSEWNRTLFGLFNYLDRAKWLNSIRHATLADNKYYQMRVANSHNLRFPKLITSNNKETLINFIKNQNDTVVKFMSQDMYTSEKGNLLGLYVNKVYESDFLHFQEKEENPITLQEYINKKYEVRYTVVGNQHLACKIDSQMSQRANIDWRRYDLKNTPHYAIDIPSEIVSKVSSLMKELNLNFGALDFIVDESDNWWFLEVNSSGQWLWIEDLSGLKISDAIAHWLTENV